MPPALLYSLDKISVRHAKPCLLAERKRCTAVIKLNAPTINS